MTYMDFDVFPGDSLGWLCRALNTRDNVCDSLFREIIYVEALLPRPHMPGQICPRACFKEGNQSHRSLNLNETNVICLILVKLILFL